MATFVLTLDGRQHPIHPRGMRIGRGPGNDIGLADEKVSHHHAHIWPQGAQVYIEDLGSMNGTSVNEMRISGPQPLQPGDRIRVGRTTLQFGVVPGALPSSHTSPLLPAALIAGVILVAAVAVVAGLIRTSPPRSELEMIPEVRDPLERARLATVMVSVCFIFEGRESCIPSGSGSVVGSQGYILTNYHVVDVAKFQDLGIDVEDSFLVSINSPDENEPVQSTYLAEVVETDQSLDLALLHVVRQASGGPLTGQLALTAVPIGDSDVLHAGQGITILGYPATGVILDVEQIEDLEDLEQQLEQMTLTLTQGTVSGFQQDDLGNQRGWIKTDAEISPGNSGGMAINEAGELVGVPTFVSAEADTLGRLGYVRPINLAQSLLNWMP